MDERKIFKESKTGYIRIQIDTGDTKKIDYWTGRCRDRQWE